MRTLTDDEITNRAASLRKRQKAEWAQLVHAACVGRSMIEAGRLLRMSTQQIAEHLKVFAIEQAARGSATEPLTKTPSERTVKALHKQYAPPEPPAALVEEHVEAGYSPAAAAVIATATTTAEPQSSTEQQLAELRNPPPELF